MWDQTQCSNTQSFSRKLHQHNNLLSLQNALGIILSIHLLHREHRRQHMIQAQSVTVSPSFAVLLFKLSFTSHSGVNQSSQTRQPSGTRGHSIGRHGIIASRGLQTWQASWFHNDSRIWDEVHLSVALFLICFLLLQPRFHRHHLPCPTVKNIINVFLNYHRLSQLSFTKLILASFVFNTQDGQHLTELPVPYRKSLWSIKLVLHCCTKHYKWLPSIHTDGVCSDQGTTRARCFIL